MPSRPGYEPSSQAKPGRRPEVAGYQPDPAARRPRAASGHRRQKLRRVRPDRNLEALRVRTCAGVVSAHQSRYRRGSIRPVHGNKDTYEHPAVTLPERCSYTAPAPHGAQAAPHLFRGWGRG